MDKLKINMNIKTEVEFGKTILVQNEVKNLLDELFENFKFDIEKRINEMVDFLGNYIENIEDLPEMSVDNISYLFRLYFERMILTESMQKVVEDFSNTDVLKIAKILINENKVKDAIHGRLMVEAVSQAIRSIKTKGDYSSIFGTMMIALELKYA